MAQLVEQLIRDQQVAGSSPATSSKKKVAKAAFFFVFSTNLHFFLQKPLVFFLTVCYNYDSCSEGQLRSRSSYHCQIKKLCDAMKVSLSPKG